MNESLQVIKNRRSIRSYKPEQIKDNELQQILESALYAPNAINQQKWHFTVIQNPAVLGKLVGIIKENVINSGHEFLAKRANTAEYNTFYHAPTVIWISGDPKAHSIQIDGGLAAQNIALAAESLDIGSCVMTSPAFLFASEEGSQMKVELGIPAGYDFICAVTLGYKEGGNPDTPPRTHDVITYVK